MQSNSYQIKNLDHLGLVSGMCNFIGLGDIIDQRISKDGINKVTYGQAVVSMVLNALGFHSQTLHMFPKFYDDKPVDRLIGEGILPEHLNDDVLGRCLDALHEYGVSELYQQIAETALEKLNLIPKALNLDITSFHTDSNTKESSDDTVVSIVKGYSRDHRPDLNQVVLELLCENQAGIPLHMRALSGNTNDQKAFSQVVKEHLKSLKSAQNTQYLIADAALYTKETIQELKDQSRYFISRVPMTLKEAKEKAAMANSDDFELLNNGYSAQWAESNYGDVSQRWLIVTSTQARDRELKTFEKNTTKLLAAEQKKLDKLCKKSFSCQRDAERAINDLQKNLKVSRLGNISYKQISSYNQPGRPKNSQQPDAYEYQVSAMLEKDENKVNALQYDLGLFILATNDCESNLTMQEMLDLYKSQQRVEGGFRFLKSPEFMTNSLYLKKPKRIEALLMIMTLSLLIYAALEYEIRKELKAQKCYFTDMRNKDCQNPTARCPLSL